MSAINVLNAGLAKGDCILTLEQVTPGAIYVDSEQLFRVSIRSNAGPLADIAGIDFIISANDPAAVGDVTDGGQFISGTNELFPIANYSLPFPSSVLFFTSVGDSVGITTSDQTLAYFTLSTMGALPGTYDMQLLSSLVIRDTFDTYIVLPGNPGGILQYTIVPVPEPSFALVWLLLSGGAMKLGRRRSPTACPVPRGLQLLADNPISNAEGRRESQRKR